MRCAVKATSPSDERSAGNRHATFCGSRGRSVAPGDPVRGWFVAPGHPVRGQQCPRLLGIKKSSSPIRYDGQAQEVPELRGGLWPCRTYCASRTPRESPPLLEPARPPRHERQSLALDPMG